MESSDPIVVKANRKAQQLLKALEQSPRNPAPVVDQVKLTSSQQSQLVSTRTAQFLPWATYFQSLLDCCEFHAPSNALTVFLLLCRLLL